MIIFFLLFTYDRSFRVHQETEGQILRWNNREGLFCSKAHHVGHDGTTLEFQTIPPEVGTVGIIDSSSLSNTPLDPFERISWIPIPPGTLLSYPSFWLLLSILLFLLLLFLYLFVKFFKKEKESAKSNDHQDTHSDSIF